MIAGSFALAAVAAWGGAGLAPAPTDADARDEGEVPPPEITTAVPAITPIDQESDYDAPGRHVMTIPPPVLRREPPAPVAPPRRSIDDPLPSFMTLDRMDAVSRFGVQIGFDKIDDINLADGFLMRYELYGQGVLPSRAACLYGHFPVSQLVDLRGGDTIGVGNLEIGGCFLPRRNSELILRLGLVVGSGSKNRDEVVTNAVTEFERQTDEVLVLPNFTLVRASVSSVRQSGRAFFRGDLGFDIAISKPSGGTGAGTFFHANVAAGVRTTSADLTFELVNWAVVDGEIAGGIERRFSHTFAFGVRSRGDNQFHIGTIFPLDQSSLGEIWILSAGVQRALN